MGKVDTLPDERCLAGDIGVVGGLGDAGMHERKTDRVEGTCGGTDCACSGGHLAQAVIVATVYLDQFPPRGPRAE